MVASGLPGWTWVNMAPFFSAAEFLCNGVTKKAWILSWQFHANCNMFHIHLESWKWSKILISSSYRYILFTWVFWDHQLSSLFVGFKLWINTPRWLPWRSTQAEELMGPDGLIPQMQQPKRKARNAMFLAVLVAILPVPWNRDVYFDHQWGRVFWKTAFLFVCNGEISYVQIKSSKYYYCSTP